MIHLAPLAECLRSYLFFFANFRAEKHVVLLTKGADMTKGLKEIIYCFFVFCMTERSKVALAVSKRKPEFK